MERALRDPRCRGAISFGIAGGLDHSLPTGTHLVASEIVTPHGPVPTDGRWSQRLMETSKRSRHARILGADHVIIEPEEKRDLFESTGAVAVDTESHITALMARTAGCLSPACELLPTRRIAACLKRRCPASTPTAARIPSGSCVR